MVLLILYSINQNLASLLSSFLVFTLLSFQIQAQDLNNPGSFEKYTEIIPGSEIQFEMTPVPGGTYILGSAEKDKNAEGDESPRKKIKIEPFWMGTYEVSYYEYEIFTNETKDLNADGSPRTDAVTRPSPPYEDPSHGMGSKGYPAVGMTQFAALQYCRWLSEKTGKFYRLATEAEWEYACKAGNTNIYITGKKPKGLDKYAWFEKNSDDHFHEAGQLLPNAWGLFDMLGNVSEWVLDQYKYEFYNNIKEEEVNPWSRPTQLHPRSVRGGCFQDPAEELRFSNRMKSSLDWKKRDPQVPKSFWWNTDSPFVGFRIIRPNVEMTKSEIEEFWYSVLGG